MWTASPVCAAASTLAAIARSSSVAPSRGVAVRIACDADLDDAAALEEPAFDHFDGGKERSGRSWEIAADHQHALDACLVVEPAEMAIEFNAARKAARRDVRHRLETGGRQANRKVDLRRKRARWNGADIERGPGRDGGAQPLDIAQRWAGRLERGARHEGGDTLLRRRLHWRLRRFGENLCGENLCGHSLGPSVSCAAAR